MNQSPARQKRVKMRWEQSMVPNDRSAWKDTSGTRIWFDLWSWDRRSSFLGKFINFEVPLLLHVWVESGRLLLGCCFRGQQRFSKAMSTSRLAWDGPFGTLQVRPLTFISMCALKTLPALPPDSFQVPIACGTFSFCHVMLLCPSMLLCLQTRRPEAASVLGSCRSFDKFRPPIAYR